ncbi:hypothetical protein PILCRDRAFT_65008 [Piloderma croceum F 1598]|uniref:Uncharacterized protein n=1 Tax=Piloderma croceum (strain F 1598) TaxID=765440 RepID=A0A0C3G4L3_PILCF|nr:hypothetical protein PILCRDRAFT_65008 [Piloderma croceum F 1598]
MDVDAFPKANTSSSTNNTVDTPNTSISSTGASDGQKRVVAKIIAESFPPFNHQAVAVGPYEEEQKRDIEYNQGELLSVILKTHAWSSSRPAHESEHEAGVLEKDINNLIAKEQEQGRSSESHRLRGSSPSSSSQHSCASLAERTRERLRAFVERVKLALAALTGLGPI